VMGFAQIVLLGLHCLAWLTLLGLHHSACIRVRPLTCWLALLTRNTG
jgi:hypothetical protein